MQDSKSSCKKRNISNISIRIDFDNDEQKEDEQKEEEQDISQPVKKQKTRYTVSPKQQIRFNESTFKVSNHVTERLYAIIDGANVIHVGGEFIVKEGKSRLDASNPEHLKIVNKRIGKLLSSLHRYSSYRTIIIVFKFDNTKVLAQNILNEFNDKIKSEDSFNLYIAYYDKGNIIKNGDDIVAHKLATILDGSLITNDVMNKPDDYENYSKIDMTDLKWFWKNNNSNEPKEVIDIKQKLLKTKNIVKERIRTPPSDITKRRISKIEKKETFLERQEERLQEKLEQKLLSKIDKYFEPIERLSIPMLAPMYMPIPMPMPMPMPMQMPVPNPYMPEFYLPYLPYTYR